MDDEEKLLGMMTIVEEQQESIKQQAESTRTIHSDLQQQLTRQQNDLAETHRQVINEYRALFKNHLTALTERGNRWLDWKKLAVSVGIITSCCVVVLMGTAFYLHYLLDEIAEAEKNLSAIESNVEKLKAFNADLRPCEVKGTQQICIRVLTSWGGQGPQKDYFVIAPK